ncbi:hypothetical protein GOBAR_AA07030 [Gossypium barbadense]|uniref:Amidase domain-containing protein n=1 Tax=Gossypium barbadense TaxID=3634 RepID=A0A2P5YD65_GOSBA|nr:hypothetical protein GOBAR_AA07030 [Gossypium barbadense]
MLAILVYATDPDTTNPAALTDLFESFTNPDNKHPLPVGLPSRIIKASKPILRVAEHTSSAGFASMKSQTEEKLGNCIEEATIESIQRAFAEDKLTSLQLVDLYLNRIQNLNPVLRSVLEINPHARVQAEEADRQRRSNSHHPRSFLHGVPVLLKDTIATDDKMNTTVGSYALLGSVVGWDAGVVEKLRNVGAVILGKVILTEWYYFRALGKTPNGWCARGGQAQNPYFARADPCGSTDYNSVVGLKPTVGLTCRAGVVPISSRQDAIGPMARTVVDAVHLLNAIVGFDPRDSEATSETAQFIHDGGYKQFLSEDGIIGKRLGVVRHLFLNTLNRSTVSTFENHLELLRARGASMIDDLNIPNIDIISDSIRSGELMLLQSEFKSSVNEYLKELAISFVRSLADIIDFNQNNPELEKLEEYGQQTLIESKRTNGIGEKERKAAEYLEKLSWDGFEKKMKAYKLDALMTPNISLAMTVLAIGGYPGFGTQAN